jgi:hypothetical protein
LASDAIQSRYIFDPITSSSTNHPTTTKFDVSNDFPNNPIDNTLENLPLVRVDLDEAPAPVRLTIPETQISPNNQMVSFDAIPITVVIAPQ